MWPRKLAGFLRPRVGQEIPEYPRSLFQIIRVSLVEHVGPDPLVGLVPQNLLHRRTVVDYGAVGLDDGYAIRGVLHQGAEALLASAQRLLGLLAFGDVPDVGHHPKYVRVAEPVAADGLHVPPGAVSGPDPVFYGRLDAGLLQGLGQRLRHAFDVLGVDLVESEGPNEIFRLVAKHPLHRRADVAHGTLGLKDHHDVGRVLYQGAKPALTSGGPSGPSGALDPERDGIRRVCRIGP